MQNQAAEQARKREKAKAAEELFARAVQLYFKSLQTAKGAYDAAEEVRRKGKLPALQYVGAALFEGDLEEKTRLFKMQCAKRKITL